MERTHTLPGNSQNTPAGTKRVQFGFVPHILFIIVASLDFDKDL